MLAPARCSGAGQGFLTAFNLSLQDETCHLQRGLEIQSDYQQTVDLGSPDMFQDCVQVNNTHPLSLKNTSRP